MVSVEQNFLVALNTFSSLTFFHILGLQSILTWAGLGPTTLARTASIAQETIFQQTAYILAQVLQLKTKKQSK